MAISGARFRSVGWGGGTDLANKKRSWLHCDGEVGSWEAGPSVVGSSIPERDERGGQRGWDPDLS